ncbi:MAG TPA: TIGR00730 family Rossman fold protein [Rhizomicrobium sp.]|nr:TIGR00730 family Rossman fold protein [Rhizomicrobium sp.]
MNHSPQKIQGQKIQGPKNQGPRNQGTTRHTICVFCGSSYGSNPVYAATAKRLGEGIAQHGYALLFGGGNVGLMGEVARAATAGGANVKGILPEFLKHLEPPLPTKEKVVITPDLQTRKAMMLSQSDAFVVLPGGLGTLDEYFEVLTSKQLKVLGKPFVVVNIEGYFDPLLALLRQITSHGFARPDIHDLQHIVPSADAAIETLNRLLQPQLQS